MAYSSNPFSKLSQMKKGLIIPYLFQAMSLFKLNVSYTALLWKNAPPSILDVTFFLQTQCALQEKRYVPQFFAGETQHPMILLHFSR